MQGTILRLLLKKLDLDLNDPASNLKSQFPVKVIEKIFDARLSEHIHHHHLLPAVQSAYHPFVSVLNDMIRLLNQVTVF